jgi:hypothetical protein
MFIGRGDRRVGDMFISNTHGFAPFEKAVCATRRAATTLPGACHRRGTCTSTIPSSGVTRQVAQGCARCARLCEGICQVATKRANKSWARWGKTVQPVSLTSSYSSLQGADRYSVVSVIIDLTEESQKGAFPSHLRHKFMLSQDTCHRREEHFFVKPQINRPFLLSTQTFYMAQYVSFVHIGPGRNR